MPDGSEPAEPAEPADPADLAVGAVSEWLTRAGLISTPLLTASVIAGGRSNLTYLLTDQAGHHLVLRRPPLSGVIASAHDVLREGRIMAALAPTDVPVPEVLAQCDDTEVLGAPFIVMAHVDGVVLRDEQTAEAELSVAARGQVGTSLVDALVRLHDVTVADVGLADLGRGVGYVSRQLGRWEAQLDRLGVAVSPLMRDVHARLQAGVPEQVETTMVHGDFRPGNVIVATDGNVRAVLDWELATLGDPLADLGWLVAYWGDADPLAPLPMSVPTTADGFGPAAALVARYAEASGRSVSDLDYYVAFALWRLAAIVAGVQARARQGAYGRAGSVALADDRVDRLVAAAAAASTRSGR